MVELREPSEPPFVVVVIDAVEVTVAGRALVVDMVTVGVAMVVVEAAMVVEADETAARGAREANGVEPRPPETVTMARARRTPTASPIPKRFPSIMSYPP
jgi:hypothetical protein